MSGASVTGSIPSQSSLEEELGGGGTRIRDNLPSIQSVIRLQSAFQVSGSKREAKGKGKMKPGKLGVMQYSFLIGPEVVRGMGVQSMQEKWI